MNEEQRLAAEAEAERIRGETLASGGATEDAHAEVAAVFIEAGWTANWKVNGDPLHLTYSQDCGSSWNVGGIDPAGTMRWANTALDPTTSSDPVETARRLVRSLLVLAEPSEEVENPGDESNGETGEEPATSGAADQAATEALSGSEEEWDDAQSGAVGDAIFPEGGEFDGGSELVADPIDADFTEGQDLGSELLDVELELSVPELPAPDPEDFAPEEIEDPGAGAFIFGDNLAHDRIVRIGQLAERANELIDAAKVGYNESEHNAVRSHVVMNMNESGAYIGGDQALFDRFIELDAVTNRVRQIEAYRDSRQDFIRTALHDAVAAFDPNEGWP